MDRPFSGIRCVSLDLDGTLLGSRPRVLHLLFIYHYLRRLGPRYGYWHALVSLKKIRTAIEQVDQSLVQERAVAAYAQCFSLTKDQAEHDYREHLLAIFHSLRQQFFAMAGVAADVRLLRQRYTLILATNPVWPPEIAALRLAWGAMSDIDFKFITHAENFCAAKPHGQYYQDLVKQSGFAATEILHIGNSVRKDAPAVEQGVQTAIIARASHLRQHAGIYVGTWQQLMVALL